MKKVLFATLCCLLVVAACGKKEQQPEPTPDPTPTPVTPEKVDVAKVSISQPSLVLTEGESAQLTATVLPAEADNKNVSWSTSDPAVATVDSYGLVTGVQEGMATITVTTEDGGKTATCAVTVMAKIIAVESVTIEPSSLELEVGTKIEMSATVLPENATDKTVTWSTSDESVLAMEEDGIFFAIAPGEAVITATAGDKSATCTVKVEDVIIPEVPVFKALKWEDLPSMITPRLGHVCVATAEGDIVVVGGHTTGFELTSTAERFHNGQWESIYIGNPHDGASATVLPDGKILVAGGFSSGWGVGQSTVCDVYDPATNSFSATGDMLQYRATSVGVLTGDGNNVLLSGNWYADDSNFELWNGSSWSVVGSKYQSLTEPHAVSDGQGTVYVFGDTDNYGGYCGMMVYKVDTRAQTVESVADTGLENYVPWYRRGEPSGSLLPDGRYLFAARDYEDYSSSKILCFDPFAAKVSEVVSLPASIEGVTDQITYSSDIIVNNSRGEAYAIGSYGAIGQWCLVVVNYNLTTGKQTVYYGGESVNSFASGTWTLHPITGILIFTGGSESNNFDARELVIAVTPFE